jgi:2-keto-4-pentenoate hydratase/2-oxohepta-3-ene-1,7-dioic acid hydratase in catechol pathway
MKICQFGSNQAGIVVEDRIYPVGEALVKAGLLRSGYTMLEIIEALAGNPAAMSCAQEAQRAVQPLPLQSTKLLAPITNPPTIWAAAANYKAHQSEMKSNVGIYDRSALSKDKLMAEIFIKPASSIIGPGGSVVLPKVANHVDFECELCAVIGKPARKVTEDHALEHIFGYLICWDFSMRDPWGPPKQHNTRSIRKGFDTFTGLGPWIVTRDEIDDPHNLSVRVEQNGKLVMRAHTGDMINNLRDLIRFLSAAATLQTGVLITTGTPAGVSKLADGDHLRGTIDKVGTMEVNVRAE